MSLRTVRVVLALLGLATLFAAIAEASGSSSARHFDDSAFDRPFGRLSYRELRAGGFTADRTLNRAHDDVLKTQLHAYRPFFNDVPIILPGTEGYKLQSIQRAYTDYNTVHLSGRHDRGEASLTIRRGISGKPVTSIADPEVHEYIRDVLAARKTFGDTAAIVAYGHKLGRAISGSSRRPPDWDQVWESHPVLDDITVEDARGLLEDRCHLVFNAADDRAALGVRLLQDGSLEQRWFNGFKPVFHP